MRPATFNLSVTSRTTDRPFITIGIMLGCNKMLLPIMCLSGSNAPPAHYFFVIVHLIQCIDILFLFPFNPMSFIKDANPPPYWP
jgi:hypothetical protein